MAANVEAGLEAYPRGAHDGVVAFGGGLGARRRQGYRRSCRASRGRCGFRGYRRLVDARDPKASRRLSPCPPPRALAPRWGARVLILNEETHQKKIIFTEDDAGHRHRRSRAHRGPAAQDHRGHGLRCVGALLRGVLRAGLSSAGRRRRARRHAAHQDLSTARLQERRRHGSALAHAGRGQHGRPASRRASAPSMPSRIRWARSSTRITA